MWTRGELSWPDRGQRPRSVQVTKNHRSRVIISCYWPHKVIYWQQIMSLLILNIVLEAFSWYLWNLLRLSVQYNSHLQADNCKAASNLLQVLLINSLQIVFIYYHRFIFSYEKKLKQWWSIIPPISTKKSLLTSNHWT